jgi:hypothetical protein
MTDKEISPAACAVLDAAFNASTWGRDDCLNDAREIAAAVLRAAAKEMYFKEDVKVLNELADEL